MKNTRCGHIFLYLSHSSLSFSSYNLHHPSIFSGKHLKMLLDSPVMSNVSNAVSGMVSGSSGGGSGTFGGYGSGGGIGVGGSGTHYNVSLR